MPCDYKKYPANWKYQIRPDILKREGDKCKFCGVVNYSHVFRGILDGKEVFQTEDGSIYSYPSGEFIKTDMYASIEPISGNQKQKAVKVVLTIMHLDHDTSNNDYSNLAAACQKCHLIYDSILHRKNSKETRNKKKGLQNLFDV